MKTKTTTNENVKTPILSHESSSSSSSLLNQRDNEEETSLKDQYDSRNLKIDTLNNLTSRSNSFVSQLLSPSSPSIKSVKSPLLDNETDQSFLERLDKDDLDDIKSDIKSIIEGTTNIHWLRKPLNSEEDIELYPKEDIELMDLKSKEEEEEENFYNHQSNIGTSHRTLDQLKSTIRENRFGYDDSTTNNNNNNNNNNELKEIETPSIKLYGNSFGYFPANSPFRLSLAKLLLDKRVYYLMISMLILQLTIMTIRHWYMDDNAAARFKFGYYWTDYILLILNICYTLEICLKCIAWGIWDDSELFLAKGKEYISIGQKLGLTNKKRLLRNWGYKKRNKRSSINHHSIINTTTTTEPEMIQQIPRAYLRSTWNRLDFTSTVCYWLSLIIINSSSSSSSLPILRAFECLRLMRLVNINDGISFILKGIKNGGPQLTDVFLFLLYFWILYSIIGIQSFKSSLRRFCVWQDDNNNNNDSFITDQHCGGWYSKNEIDGTLIKNAYYLLDGKNMAERAKGYICPVGFKCLTMKDNIISQSYDNIFTSMQMVFVIYTANTFSDHMYSLMDTDGMPASIFYLFAIFFLFLWMANLLISVISAALKVTQKNHPIDNKNNKNDFNLDLNFPNTTWANLYISSVWIFVSVIFISLILSSRINIFSNEAERKFEYNAMFIVNVILLVEILWRFTAYFPSKWREFFKHWRNLTDLIIAIICMIIVIPSIHEKLGRSYEWLRFFEIVRFYRVVLTVPFIRRQWAQVLRNTRTIINLTIFYYILLFISAIIFTRYFEGFADLETIQNPEIQFTFHNIPNSLLGLFVITTTEGWSELMYDNQSLAPNKISIIIAAILFMAWFVLSNSMVLNIFIGIIADSLDISENVKRKNQAQRFVMVEFPQEIKKLANFKNSAVKDLKGFLFNWKEKNQQNQQKTILDQTDRIKVEKLLLKGIVIQEFLKDELQLTSEGKDENQVKFGSKSLLNRFKFGSKIGSIIYNTINGIIRLTFFKKILSSLFWISEDYKNPFFQTSTNNNDKQFISNYSSLAENFQIETDKTIMEKRQFLKDHPGFNTTLYFFKPSNKFRRFCQKFTRPPRGKRYEGEETNKWMYLTFVSIMGLCTCLLVISACYATPLYKKPRHFGEEIRWNWSSIIELIFASLFFIEFLIKIIADGVLFTPNAYLGNAWNCIDFIVLCSLWVNVIAIIYGNESLSRIVRGLKALRALRLLTISTKSEQIFHGVMIAGLWKIIGASILSLTLLFPFAIWGVNLFNGRFGKCNDNSLSRAQCLGEFSNNVGQWDILMPRAYDEPQLEMNSFASTLLTLFEITSLEGWVDVLQYVTYSTGVGTPFDKYSSTVDSLFLIFFIYVAIIFILTLFVSVIIGNYAKISGSGFLTIQQISWKEVKKLLNKTKPHKIIDYDSLSKLRKFLYDWSPERKKSIKLTYQSILLIHILAILLEKYPPDHILDNFRYSIFIISSSLLLISNLGRIIYLGPKKFFKGKWNCYELFIFLGAFITSFISFFVSRSSIFANINKLFLVGIFTVFIQMSNRLSHLLQIASASLPSMVSLLLTWGVLFLVFAIAINQIFGLTRTGPNTSSTQNGRTVTKVLIMLFKNSFGENWNYTMKDFAIEAPFCVSDAELSLTDCGSEVYAYVLFIAWNVVSMYIFVNMFISLIFENFSYVYYSDKDSSIMGGKNLNRQEIRKFKQIWANYDPKGTGYISVEQLPKFLRDLDGFFSFKVFEDQWCINEIVDKFVFSKRNGLFSYDPYDFTMDVQEVNEAFKSFDSEKAKSRKKLYDLFIEEAIYDMNMREPINGISFQRMIIQVPLYARFDVNNCLNLKDFIDRMIKVKILSENLTLKRKICSLKMVSDRLFFLQKTGRFNKKLQIYKESLKDPFKTPFDDVSYPQINNNNNNNISNFHTPEIIITQEPTTTEDRTYWSSPTKYNFSTDDLNDNSIRREISSIADVISESDVWRDQFLLTSDKSHKPGNPFIDDQDDKGLGLRRLT